MNKFEASLKICLLVGTRNTGLLYGKNKTRTKLTSDTKVN